MTMLCVVMTPVAFAVVYLLFLVTPQYAAESRFSVQASQMNTTQSNTTSAVTSLLSGGAGGAASAAAGFVDGWAVQDFLNSRDCMRQLDRQIGLRNYLAKKSLDPINHLSPNANEDELFRAYQRVVHNSYNMIEQINVLQVDAYSPNDSRAISNGLLAVIQDFVNRMNQQGIDDALKVNRQTLRTAEGQDKIALASLERWRIEHGNLDPAADAAMLLNQVGLVESSLSTAEVNLDEIRAMKNPNHPMLQPAERQVQALKSRLSDLRSRMSGQGNTSASEIKTYVELTNAQTFADGNLLLARQNYQQSFTNAMALQRYLSIIARPVSEVRPSLPSPFMFLLISFALGCTLAGSLALVQALYRSFRHA
jgi:capsular polysaccharide transport system permease protein